MLITRWSSYTLCTQYSGMVQAAGQFFVQIESIGAKATSLPGAVRKLGESMIEMVEGQKDIASHQADWVSPAHRDYVTFCVIMGKESYKVIVLI